MDSNGRNRLTHQKTLIFDFDGTMCFLFKNYDLSKTAELLSKRMRDYHIVFSGKQDSFDIFDEVLRQTENDQKLRKRALLEANNMITQAEVEAIESCEPIRGIREVLAALMENGVRIGVATNNSKKCVRKFLERFLPETDMPIWGRVACQPQLMKPNPWSIQKVCEALETDMENTLFIGDTKRDYLAALSAGCAFIGMTANERKRMKLMDIIPENRMVSDYFDLQKWLYDR